MSIHDPSLARSMPRFAPLDMPTQILAKPFHDPTARPAPQVPDTVFYRLVTFVPALLTTCTLIVVIADWFKPDGFMATELAMIGLVGFSAFWIALSVASATIGLFLSRDCTETRSAVHEQAMDVALLVPIYNENVEAVFSRVDAMRQALSKSDTSHRFALFVLSDTSDPAIALRETALHERVCCDANPCVPVYYRRRAENLERKTGNIRNWIENWGADWDAFLTLDADSLMSSQTIIRLADEMVTAPSTALIQTVPRLMGSNTLFARVQQFANNIYGTTLARGLDRWAGNDGNYWGHNAIIRTRAFAACAGLPVLSGRGALGGTIKSHDFVEAALLRRAGWSVRLKPEFNESYEEAPQTIVDYVLRDRRWCQGNLQHLRLLFSRGFTAGSRFHMLQGAMAYVASVMWFFLLVLWALMGRSETDNVFVYFSDTNPLFPQWPQMDAVSRTVVLVFVLGLLLAPKAFGIVAAVCNDPSLSRLGGPVRFSISAFFEIALSFILAPILMVQHVCAVARTLLGMDAGWSPQNRTSGSLSIAMLLRFHLVETTTGLLLVCGIAAGVISLWLLPIALSLALSVPVSKIFSMPIVENSVFAPLMNTEEQIRPVPIIQAYAVRSQGNPHSLMPEPVKI